MTCPHARVHRVTVAGENVTWCADCGAVIERSRKEPSHA